MFETEPIRFLQNHASDWFTWFMLIVTSGGSAFVRDLFISVTLFGINFRKGIVLANLCWLAALFTDFFKNLFAMPRPYEVDATVVNLQEDWLFKRLSRDGAATRLWQFIQNLSQSSELAMRSFPSGHASTATALWGGLYSLFGKPTTRWLAIILIPLIAFSRVYLGKHFIGDVIGGVMISVILIYGARLVLRRDTIFRLSLSKPDSIKPIGRQTFFLLIYILGLPVALFFLIPAVKAEAIGSLFGLNVAFFIVWVKGLPDDSACLSKRLARIALGLLTGFGAHIIIGYLGKAFDMSFESAFKFVQASVSSGFSILVTITLSKRLRLYEPKNPGDQLNPAL
ncbi:MAG: phosphatase PAP2 family protein [Acidobacteriota bacterium]